MLEEIERDGGAHQRQRLITSSHAPVGLCLLRSSGAQDVAERIVAFMAGELEHPGSAPRHRLNDRPPGGVGRRIVNHGLVKQRVAIDERESFGDLEVPLDRVLTLPAGVPSSGE